MLVVDTSGLDRIISWDPAQGVVECEPGVTIEQLWPGISGANRVYAYAPEGAEISVSHA